MNDGGEDGVLSPSDSQLQWLAHDLCVKLGFCGIGRQIQILRDLPTTDPADWADEVFRAEGMDPRLYKDLWRRVRDLIQAWLAVLES